MWPAKRSLVGAACKNVVALTLFLPAFAAEAKPSADAYRAELDQLGAGIAKLDEEYNVAKIRISEVERQILDSQRVGRSELQPGDLVFFGSPIHHVGIYVGGGKMINSPETGERVGVRSMERGDYVGGGRPGI